MARLQNLDRRRRPRTAAQNVLAAISVVGGSDQGIGVVRDVSDGGLCIRTPMPPPRFAKVALRISLGDQTHQVVALVRRVERTQGAMYDVGLQFAPNDGGKAGFVAAFLAQCPPAPPT
jgi:hypothetical protein